MHIGLIGGGNISSTHARAARACGVDVAAVFGTNEQKVRALAAEFGGVAYSDFERFLAHRPMEIVAIGSPSGLHAEHGIAAAEHGLHVLVEKPIDISIKRVDALISAAKRADVKLGVFFQDRFKPDLIHLKEFLDRGRLGRLLLIDARVKWYRPPEYYRDSRWRGTYRLDGGGALMNQGIHTIDLLLWLVGEATPVCARTSTGYHSIEAEDTALALLKFASGAVGVLQATTAAYPGYPRRLEMTGTEGTIVVEGDRVIACDLRSNAAWPSISETRNDTQVTSPVILDVTGHAAAIADFLSAISEGRPPRCDGLEGRRSVVLVEAIYSAGRR